MANDSHQRGFSWPLVLFTALLALGLVSFLYVLFSKKQGPHHRTRSLNNAKSIASALNLFRQEYGSYPSHKTREAINDGDARLFDPDYVEVPEGDHANAYFAQLLVTGYLDTESTFHTPGVSNVEIGDDLLRHSQVLSAGENGFAYIMTEEKKALTGDDSALPLVIAPAIRGGRNPRFDRIPFGGVAVYGTADGSAGQSKITEGGKAMTDDGVPFFQTGPGSLFGDEIPVVKMPLKKYLRR